MKLRTLREAPIKKGTRVLIRADFDVVTSKVEDNFKVQACLATILFVLKKGGQARIISHLGRPHGQVRKEFSLKPMAEYLGKIVGRKVVFITDPVEEKSFKKYNTDSRLLFFENIRFWPGEEKNDRLFAARLAKWGDIYINEAFANSHRRHASMEALARQRPAFAGFHLEKEIDRLSYVLKKPRRPFIVITGGIKLETKLPLVKRFLTKADLVLVAGGIANSIFHAQGLETGKSTVDILRNKSILRNKKLYLPLDVVTSKKLRSLSSRITTPDQIRREEYAVDIGPRSIELFSSAIKTAKTILWNGPLGLTPYFSKGTKQFAKSLVRSSAFKVIGGGDTIAVLQKLKLPLKSFGHVSTGGGAMLEFLAGKKLPGLRFLEK